MKMHRHHRAQAKFLRALVKQLGMLEIDYFVDMEMHCRQNYTCWPFLAEWVAFPFPPEGVLPEGVVEFPLQTHHANCPGWRHWEARRSGIYRWAVAQPPDRSLWCCMAGV